MKMPHDRRPIIYNNVEEQRVGTNALPKLLALGKGIDNELSFCFSLVFSCLSP